MRPIQTALLWLYVLPCTALAEEKTSCPLVLPAETVVVNAPASWRGYSSSIVRLTGFGMMAGPPESMTYLVPADSVKRKGVGTTVWRFAKGDEKWMYCTYDGSAAIQISKRLSDQAATCVATSRRDDAGMLVELTAICR